MFILDTLQNADNIAKVVYSAYVVWNGVFPTLPNSTNCFTKY